MINLKGATVGPAIAAMDPGDAEKLKELVRRCLPADAGGHVTYGARANAVKGDVPK
jgi:hypothetical protein